MTETKRVRIGLVGCGVIARRHGEALRGDERVDWKFVCDPNLDAARLFREQFAAAAETTNEFAAALGQHSLDAVILCSPNALHHVQTCAALDRGLHVLCEKPLALRREHVDDVIVRAVQSQRIVSVAHQRRYKTAYVTARRELLAHADVYGPIREVHLFLCENWSQTIVGTWRDDPTQNLGYFGDAGIHLIDAIDFVAGLRARRLYATSDRRNRRVEIVTRVLADFGDGVNLSAHFVGDAGHFREDLHFHGERADLLIRDGALFRCREGRCEPITDLEPDGNPATAFIDAVLANRPTVSPPDVARPILAWNTAVMESLKRGEWVEV